MPRVILACFLSLLVTAASAQAPSPPSSATPAPGKAVARKKSAPGAKPAGQPSAAAESGPCQIGVIPLTGNEFGVQQVGFTAFGNEYASAPVDSWGLDDLVISRVRAAAGGRAVRRIAYSKDDLARMKESHSIFRDRDAEAREFVQRSAGNAGCERYLLIHKSGSQFVNTNQSVSGYGIVKWGNPLQRKVFLFALTFIRVYDGQTFQMVNKANASIEEQSTIERLFLTKPIRGPYRELDESSFPAAATEAASNPVYRDGVRALLASSLDRTLPAMLK